MEKNKIYTIRLHELVDPTAVIPFLTRTFSIPVQRQHFYLKSVRYDVAFMDAFGLHYQNIYNNVLQINWLQIQAAPANRTTFANQFDCTSMLPATPAADGQDVYMFHPGELKFDKFIIGQELLFSVHMRNLDAIDMNHMVSVAVEIENIRL